MGLSIEEQETIVNFSRNDERASIYTSDSTMITKLSKLLEATDTEWKIEEVHRDKTGKVIAYTYSCPAKCIVYWKKRMQREFSDEQRARVAKNLKSRTQSKL